MDDPQTAEQWQLAVDLADGWLHIDAAEKYGLLHPTNTTIDVARCEEILRRGRAAGYTPSPDAPEQLARALLLAEGGNDG